MNVEKPIRAYVASQPEPKRTHFATLHSLVLKFKLWRLDGKDATGRQVANPIILYGLTSPNASVRVERSWVTLLPSPACPSCDKGSPG